MIRVPAIHYTLSHVDSTPDDVGLFLNVSVAGHRPGMDSHP